jgi:hypothetical protein
MMYMTLVLMLSGWSKSGKDAAALMLCEEMGFHRLAFADPLKVDVAHKTGVPLFAFHCAAKDVPMSTPCLLYPNASTPRDILIEHAARMRSENPTIYAESIVRSIKGMPHTKRIVISDWRFKCEYEHIRASLSPPVRIIRARIVRPGITPSASPTEHELDDERMDVIIANDGTISDLRHTLHATLK